MTSNPTRMKMITLTGMPGSGKSTFKEVAHRAFGVDSWYVGQPLVDACITAGIEATYANRMRAGVALGLFEPSDPLKFIKYSFREMKLRRPCATAIIFDSVRSHAELEFLRSAESETFLIAVVLGRVERIRRLLRRDHITFDQVEARDRMEVGLCDPFQRQLGVGQLVAMADYYVLTPDNNLQASSFTRQVGTVLKHLGIRPLRGDFRRTPEPSSPTDFSGISTATTRTSDHISYDRT